LGEDASVELSIASALFLFIVVRWRMNKLKLEFEKVICKIPGVKKVHPEFSKSNFLFE